MSENIREIQRTPSPVRNYRLMSPTQSCSPSQRLTASKLEQRDIHPTNPQFIYNLEHENEAMLNNNKVQANRLLDVYAKADTLTQRLKTKYIQSDIQTSKIMAQEKDIVSLSKNLDDKSKTYSILKGKLDQKTADAFQLAADKNTLYNNLEQFKFDSHNNVVEMQAKFNAIMIEKNQNITNWMNKYNRLEEEIEKTVMSQNMQIANEKHEAEKNIEENKKSYNMKKTDVMDIQYKNTQSLKKANEEIYQYNMELKKENDLLMAEKKLLENELKLIDRNNEDARMHVGVLELDLDKEINAKEAEKLTNHGLKQNQIDLNGKFELLEREQKNLNDNMNDLKKDNVHLIETLDEARNQLLNSNNECDEQRMKNKCADDDFMALNNELENMKQHTSEVTLGFEQELTNLNKSLNDICSAHNIRMKEKEKDQRDKCYNHELDKANKINEFIEIRRYKEDIINDLKNDLENNRIEQSNVITNLTTQNIALENELTNINYDNDNIESDLMRTKTSQESEIIFLQNLNTNLLNEITIKGNEQDNHIKSLKDDIKVTDLNGCNILSDKDSTINKLGEKVDNLEKDCDIKTEENRDLTVTKNNLTVELDKCRLDHNLIKEELCVQINCLNNSIKDTINNFDIQRHDSECNRLSRDESLRLLEDKLRNLHEDRLAREKCLHDDISELTTRIDEKVKEYDTYYIDSQNQKSLLQNNNNVKDMKIKELEANLIDLDKMYCQTRMELEKNVMNINNDIMIRDKELDGAYTQIKVQSHTLTDLTDRNNKLTSELVMTHDSYNRDKQQYDMEYNKQSADIQDLNYNLNILNQDTFRMTNERNEILTQKEIETQRLKSETERICDELSQERNKRLEVDTKDKFNQSRIKEMEEANEYWRNKYGNLEREKRDAMFTASNSRIELAEVKEIINRYKQ